MRQYATDLNKIAQNEQITVTTNSDLEFEGIDGLIQKNNGQVEIVLNPHSPHNRQRFTFAHELGHYFLGHLTDEAPCFRDNKQSYDLYHFDPKETQANNFAAALLMPEEKINDLILNQDITSIPILAKIFKVSEQAMRIRLKNLGIISYGR